MYIIVFTYIVLLFLYNIKQIEQIAYTRGKYYVRVGHS